MYMDIVHLGGHVRAIWEASDFDSTEYVLLLPHDDSRLNALLRSAFAAKLGGRRGAVVDDDRVVPLLELYSLYAFSSKLIVGSFDLPHGRKLRNLLDSGVATEEELINDVILGGVGSPTYLTQNDNLINEEHT